MAEPRTAIARIPHIELLRVLATIGIFLYHLWTVIPLSADTTLSGPLLARVPLLGTVGVIIFNGITGFVLAVPYLGQETLRPLPGVWDFFRSRFGRICQHYYPVLLLWTIPCLFFEAYDQHWREVLVAFVSHLVFVHTLSAQTFFAIVPALWWLGMLAQLYLVYPWLLRVWQRLGAGRACGIICLLAWSAWIGLTLLANHWPGSPWAMLNYMAYFNLPVRLPEFALGMWLASAWNRAAPWVRGPDSAASPLWTVLPLLVLLGCGVLLQDAWVHWLFGPLAHLYLVAWCVLATLAILHWPPAAWLGSRRLTLDLAAASYGIYLLHQPLLGYANVLLADILRPGWRFVVLGVGIWLLCYRAAVLLNLLVFRLLR
ncbi:MAG: acyltransferase family protein [Candidatus Tectimicrobiota bacterium]